MSDGKKAVRGAVDKKSEVPLVGYEYGGKKIVLPDDPERLKLDDAIEALSRIRDEENTVLQVQEFVEGYPEDVLVAFANAMRDQFGWVEPRPMMTWFGPIPPQVVYVRTGPKFDDTVQVYEGNFTVPALSQAINVQRHYNYQKPGLFISGKLKKAEIPTVKALCVRTREYLAANSIYRGKALRMKVDGDGEIIMKEGPEFIDTTKVRRDEIILNDDVQALVETSIMVPIRNTQRCRDLQIPLKRGVLLEGRYGTGKTLVAHWTSAECVDNNWTYIVIDDVRALSQALELAKRYQPCVIFAEDVERIAETRDQDGNDLLNVIDGVLSKNTDIMVVLTTNHVEKINKAMLRPGRLDAVIRVQEPDAKSVERLMRLYGRGLIGADENLSSAAAKLAGNIPATIREVTERAKLGMIGAKRTFVTGEDLLTSATSMEHHMSLMAAKPTDKSIQERLGGVLIEALAGGEGGIDHHLREMVSDLNSNVVDLSDTINTVARNANQGTGSALNELSAKIDSVRKDTGDIKRAVAAA